MASSDHAFTAPTLHDNAYSGVLSFLSRRFIARAVRAGIAGSARFISCAPCIKRAREHSGHNEAR